MFVAELGHDDLEAFDLSSLRTGIMAGSPCPIEVMRKVIDQMNMSEVTIAYGMTETSPVSTQTSTTDSVEHRVTTVGRVLPHVEAKIVDPETGDTVERGSGRRVLHSRLPRDARLLERRREDRRGHRRRRLDALR